MSEDELYLILSDPKISPEEKKRIQEKYNREHNQEEGTDSSGD